MVLGSALLTGCGPAGGGTYCQSGPRYGTQCYSNADVTAPPGQRPPTQGEPGTGEPR